MTSANSAKYNAFLDLIIGETYHYDKIGRKGSRIVTSMCACV